MAGLLTCLLCALVILKPQEFVPALASIPIVYITYGLTILCIGLDILWARIRPRMAPQVPFFLGFLAWSLFVTLIKYPGSFTTVLESFVILSVIFFAVVIGASTPGGIKLFAAILVGCALLITATAISQYFNPFQCHLGDSDDWAARGTFIPDGRPCEFARDCRENAPLEDGNYICERPGLFNTSTIGGRVRYRGALGDPNELSLMISSALPFALAFTEIYRKRTAARSSPARGDPAGERARPGRILPVLMVALIGFTVVISRSRTGLIVYLMVTGIYFIRRVGAWGMIMACLIAPPMLLFGGRGGSEADASADERTELLLEGFEIIQRTKGIGVGAMQFTNESSINLTAHNSFVLAAAETGMVGLFLFGMLLYLSIKVPMALWFGRYRISTTTARMAPALAISLCGMAVGIVFLSWTYEHILYMLMGASGALYTLAKAEDPRIDLRLSRHEKTLVPAGIFALLAAMYVGARLHM